MDFFRPWDTLRWLKTHLYLGIGYAWAGHNKLKLIFDFLRMLLKSSPELTFGLTLPTGSV